MPAVKGGYRGHKARGVGGQRSAKFLEEAKPSVGGKGDLGGGIGVFTPLLGSQFERRHVHEAGQHGPFELCCNPSEVLGLLRIGPVDRSPTLVVSRCGTNATLKSNTNSGEAPRFHALTERFRNSPTVIGNDNRSRHDKRSVFTWTILDLDLPPPSAILMRRRANLPYRCSDLIAGGFRFSASGTGRPASHLDDVSSEVIQRRMVGENEVLVDGQSKAVTDFCHDFGLLHRINAQLSLEVLVHLNEVSRITRVVNHHGDQHLFDVSMGAGRDNGDRNGCRSGCWGRRNSRCGYRRRRRCSGATALHSLNVADHVVQRRVVGQHEVLVDR